MKTKPYIKKVSFLDVFKPRGMYNHIRFFSKISFLFFIISLTPLKVFTPVKYTAYVLINNNRVVGNAYLTQRRKRAELAMGLNKEFRFEGYGSKLIKRLLEENKNKVQIFLRVEENNKIAKRFFKKHGFKESYKEMVLSN